MEWISLIAALLSGVGGGMLAIGIMREQIQIMQRLREQDRQQEHDRYMELQREREQDRRAMQAQMAELQRRIDSLIVNENK